MPIPQSTKILTQLPKTVSVMECSGFLFAWVLLSLFCTCHLPTCSRTFTPQYLVTLCTKLEVFTYATVSTWYLLVRSLLPSHVFCKTDLTLVSLHLGTCISLVCEAVALLSVAGGRGDLLFNCHCILSHSLTRREIMLISPFSKKENLKTQMPAKTDFTIRQKVNAMILLMD